MMLTAIELVHTAVLERYAGDSATGAAYAAGVNVLCYFEGGAQLVEAPAGTETGTVGTFWTNETDVPVGSRVTVNGLTGYVDRAAPYADGQGLDHVEVTLSAVPRVAATRTATVSLFHAVTPSWDDASESTTATAPTAYAADLAARITAQITRSTSTDVETAEETLVVGDYLVSVFAEVEPTEGDEVRVTACPDDTSFEGRTLRVLHVIHGSALLERDLFCSLVGD